jgi:reverse gyrase
MVKKRGAPSKKCPHCGKTIHARSVSCKFCKKEIVKKSSAGGAKKSKSEIAGVLRKIKSLGGIETVAEALKAYKHSAETVKTLGGYEKAAEVIAALKQLKG